MDNKKFMETFGLQLDVQQLEALKNINGPSALIAVPGSGKTTTLVARVGYMVEACKIPPEEILVLTFTTAAARDMKERFASTFGAHNDRVQFRTINSICLELVRDAMSRGLIEKREMLPVNASEVKSAMKKCGEYPAEGEVQDAVSTIGKIKNLELNEYKIKSLTEEVMFPHPVEKVYENYQRSLEEKHLMDYDDQIVMARDVLRENPDFRDRYRERWKYILVDEAQDTSKLQHSTIDLLVGPEKNIFMVGDEDQSIYGFRGAFPEALTSFSKRYSGATVKFLENNYRSLPAIVSSASRLISENTTRYSKKMNAVRKGSSKVETLDVEKRADQYSKIVDIVKRRDAKTTAIIGRNNENIVPFVARLEKERVPFNIQAKDVAFFLSPVVRLVKSIFAFAIDPSDTEAFKGFIYKTGSFVSKKSVEDAIAMYKRVGGRPFADFVLSSPTIKDTSKQRLEKVFRGTAKLRYQTAINALGILEALYKKSKEATRGDLEKFFILRAMITKSGMYLEDFLKLLDHVEEVIRYGKSSASATLFLTTAHSSKGLQYDNVCIIDAIDYIWPGGGAMMDSSKMEEERRLFYVAMTRARSRLAIVNYTKEGQLFVEEALGIREEKREEERRVARQQKTASTTVHNGFKVHQARREAKKRPVERIRPYTPKVKESRKVSAIEYMAYRKGTRFEHKIFGKGRVVAIDANKMMDIVLDNGVEKKISLEICLEKDLINVVDW